MVLTQRHGLLVEATDPAHVAGVHHCWISDRRPGSPTIHQILAHATGGSVAEAIENATVKLQEAIKGKAGPG